ncbi:unnamed protein product [Arctogadus glacialis]
MVEPSDRPASAAQRLGSPDSYGVSTLEPSLRPPTTQPSGGRQVPLRVQLLDDTQEVFQISWAGSVCAVVSPDVAQRTYRNVV